MVKGVEFIQAQRELLYLFTLRDGDTAEMCFQRLFNGNATLSTVITIERLQKWFRRAPPDCPELAAYLGNIRTKNGRKRMLGSEGKALILEISKNIPPEIILASRTHF